MSTLFEIHRGLGYLLFLAVIAVAILAFNRAKNGREFEKGPFSGVMIFMDIQLTIGLLLYLLDKYWTADSPAVAFLHPIVMLLALGAGHAGLARARKEQMAADAYRTVGRMMGISAALVTVGIGLASAA